VHAAAACETAKGVPAIVAFPVRGLVVEFAAIVNATEPGPMRPVPLWNVRKLLVLVALQPQLACVVTTTVPDAAAADVLLLAGLIE
jgi:hypothetical protein